ncbi:MAG: two component response regulator [Myxococcaceae bacterium]|jgi:DNA-binding response OmpR family regulator|nr:two component response regulator [Myxococcaceae bacterium]MEA2749905.1 two-component system, OmpR family, phosphate regulon response regulator OmpR [Myxococcales bacterium]
MGTATAHILLVDDHPKALEIFELRLKSLGHRITIAHNGEVAISIVERDRPDLVVLDVTMPEVNGYQACRAIKRLHPQLPVLILTAKTEPADRYWALQSGADEFLNKPIDPAVLVQKIQAHLGAPP